MASRSAKQPRLAILGASARAAAQSAVRAGLEVVAADLFADVDLSAIAPTTRIRDYPAGFADWLAGVDADAWIYTGGLENYPDVVDQLARILPLWGNAGAPLRRCRQLPSLHAALQRAGIPFPETRTDPTGLPHDGSWLCKSDGCGGSGVWRLDGAPALTRATAAGTVYQRCLSASQGLPASAAFALDPCEPDALLGVTRQLIGPEYGAAPFQYAGSVGPIEVTSAIRTQLKKLEQTLSADLGLQGIVGVDLWLGDDQLWVLEVNPRYSASVEVLELATGKSALSRLARQTAASFTPGTMLPARRTRRSAKKQIIYSKCGLTPPADVTPGCDAGPLATAQTWLADLPPAGTRVEAGSPVMTLLGFVDSADDQRRFAEAFTSVETQLYSAIEDTPHGDKRSENRSHQRHPRPRRSDAGGRADAREP